MSGVAPAISRLFRDRSATRTGPSRVGRRSRRALRHALRRARRDALEARKQSLIPPTRSDQWLPPHRIWAPTLESIRSGLPSIVTASERGGRPSTVSPAQPLTRVVVSNVVDATGDRLRPRSTRTGQVADPTARPAAPTTTGFLPARTRTATGRIRRPVPRVRQRNSTDLQGSRGAPARDIRRCRAARSRHAGRSQRTRRRRIRPPRRPDHSRRRSTGRPRSALARRPASPEIHRLRDPA